MAPERRQRHPLNAAAWNNSGCIFKSWDSWQDTEQRERTDSFIASVTLLGGARDPLVYWTGGFLSCRNIWQQPSACVSRDTGKGRLRRSAGLLCWKGLSGSVMDGRQLDENWYSYSVCQSKLLQRYLKTIKTNKQTNTNYDSSLDRVTWFLFINISITCRNNTFEEFSPFFWLTTFWN